MNKYIDAEKLIKFKEVLADIIVSSQGISTYQDCKDIAEREALLLISTLQQGQSKFNVGDLVMSKKNPHLTYKILEVNLPNELGKTDYKVEIFTDNKPGLLNEPHNIHLISSDKIEDWGELVQQVDLENEINNYMKIHHLHIKDGGRIVFDNNDSPNFMCDIRDIAHYFYELGRERKEE